MGQITSALVGIALVLSAVFIPMAFISGSSGVIYRQFSLTIVSAMLLSVVVAIVLTPALCATFLKPVHKGHTMTQHGFFGAFNRMFDANSSRYQSGVRGLLKRSKRVMLVYASSLRPLSLCSSVCRPRSCRTKTRASSSALCSCPPAPRKNAPSRFWSRWSTTSW